MGNKTKEWIQYASALFMLLSGVVLTFISFFLHDDVTDNVLWYVGQTIIYAASVFGISIYVKGRSDEIKMKVEDFIKKHTGDKNETTSQKDSK